MHEPSDTLEQPPSNVTAHLITGATGFIGNQLVTQLLKTTCHVFVLVRPETWEPEKYYWATDAKLTILFGDVTQEDLQLKSDAIANLQKYELTIWHLAACLSFSVQKKALVTKTNVLGTEHTVALANQLSARLVYVSTAYVCGNQTRQIPERGTTNKLRFQNHYEYTKYQAEEIVRMNATTPYLIIRPSIVIGDAYVGKAEGCTFGYYRWAFMLFLLHRWIRETCQQKTRSGWLLRRFGTKVHMNSVHAPWLLIPFPKEASVNMVPLDWVVQSMMQLHQDKRAWPLQTFHLTNAKPIDSYAVLTTAVTDLPFTGVKYLRCSAWWFRLIIRCAYYITWPWRGYTRSVYKYLPYVVTDYQFLTQHSNQLEVPAAPILTRATLQDINHHAFERLFPTIDTRDIKRCLNG